MSFLLKKFSTFLILTLMINLLSNNLIKISFAQKNNNVNCSLDNPCAKVNKLLEPCNDILPMPPKLNDTDTVETANYYVGTKEEAKCWCNKEFYDLLLNCTICLSSSTVNATIEPLDDYKNDCQKYGTEFKETSQKNTLTKGPNRFLLALGISALVTLIASLSFCLFAIRKRKKNSLAYEQLKTDFHSRGRGIEISGINENDEKGELYSPTAPMPPPLAHQPQNEQQQQSKDQNLPNSIFNNGMYGPQQYYVEANQAQVPTFRESYEYSDNTDNFNVVNIDSTSNNGLSQQYVYQHYSA